MKTDFPRKSGTYALILHLPTDEIIVVGRMGDFCFPAGWYVYVGSALGPGGLAGRLGRHLAPGALHWHIDYLRQAACLKAICFQESERRLEHLWAQDIQDEENATIPCPGFGASDCRCPSHLFHFPVRLDRKRLSSITGRAVGWVQFQTS